MDKEKSGQNSLIRLLKRYRLTYAIGRAIMKPCRALLWEITKKKIELHLNADGLNKTEKRDRRIIVSLTSYPGRIKFVPYSIALMLNQTMKPDKIILWLGEKEFPGKKLPRIFRKLLDYGVEVQFREDIGPHTKYFYAVQEYPEDVIITIDDDVLYGPALVESLYRSYQKHPDCVSASCIYKMKFDSRGAVMKYDDWEQNYIDPMHLESHQYFALGVAGVLYPPRSLPQETFNLPALKKYSFHNDDIWLKFMEVINDTRVVFAPNESNVPNKMVPLSQNTALWKTNILGGKTDQDMFAMLNAYNNWFGDGRKLTDIMAEGK